MQTVGQLVELAETGGHAVELASAAAHRFDLVERLLQHVLEPDVVLARAPLGHLVDSLLRAVDDVVDLTAHTAGGAVAELHDLRAGLDQPPQDRALAHDLRVVGRVGGGRHGRDQRVQIRRTADLGEGAVTCELGRDRDRVGRFAATIEVEDRVVDRLVRRPVEVGGLEHLDDVGDRVLAQQHRAEHALLGDNVLRRRAVELDAAGVSARPTAGESHDIGDTHCLATPRARRSAES